jgi:hypothetical protein
MPDDKKDPIPDTKDMIIRVIFMVVDDIALFKRVLRDLSAGSKKPEEEKQ